MMVPPGRSPITLPVITTFSDEMAALSAANTTSTASAAYPTANLALFTPIYLREPFAVSKAFVCNGATIGTDSWDIGVYQMTDMATGRLDLLRSTGAVLSAGSANVVQESGVWRVAPQNLTAGADSTDGTTYTTASVTLKAGRLYLLSVVNTAASAAVISSIAGGPTWTSRATTQWNTTAHRVSIWSGVPTVDRTGTIVITFGATQTGARWVLDEFSGVDTATTDGVVQGVTGTGTSTTPLATLAALGSANNAVYGALANAADSTTTPGTGLFELSDDATAVTPAQFLQTEFGYNDTTLDGTITSGVWGAAAVEIKADTTTPFVIPPSLPGTPNVYMGFVCSGTTATFFRQASSASSAARVGALRLTSSFPLRSSCTAAIAAAADIRVLAGFSSRSLIG